MHHLDVNETYGEKAWWELHKNAMCHFEQILEAIPHKTVPVLPLSSHLWNHPSKTKDIWDPVREGRTCSEVTFSYGFLYMVVPVFADQQAVSKGPAKSGQ